MAGWLGEVLRDPATAWAVAACVAGGLVYGFAGFGAALVAVPVLAAVYSPSQAVGIFALCAPVALLTVAPRAWREADRRATTQLLAGAALTLPLGVWVLRAAPGPALQWVMSLVVLGTVTALLAGWRRDGADGRRGRLGVGAATGLLGGATGLTGPVMVVFQLAGDGDATRVRANTTLFLSLLSLLLLPLLALGGVVGTREAAVGLVALPAYAVATVVGQALFRPSAERVYRVVAYTVVTASGLAALPVWG